MDTTSRRIDLPTTLLLGTLLATACSSGGGGGGSTPPVIVGAAFVGASATPAAGDTLVLTFSKAVTLVAGALFDDADLTLSSGSLGAVTGPPAQWSGHSIVVTLGAGVALVPGTTTIAFGTGNDVVQDAGGLLGSGGAPRVITAGDGDNPVVTALTLNGIDGELNGSGPAGGALQVPRSGFTIDVDFSDPTSPVDAALTVITSSGTVYVSGAPRSPGENLADALVPSSVTGSASFAVQSPVDFLPGPHAITATLLDTSGMPSMPVSFAFQTTNVDDGIRPLETRQTWFLDLSRDLESYTAVTNVFATAVTDVTINSGSNGRADLEDLFRILGLHWSAPLPNVQGGMDSNQVVTERFKSHLTTDLTALFAGVDVEFTFTSPGPFPNGEIAVPYATLGFSQICIAGAAGPSPSPTLGAALFDPNNATQNDNCETAFLGIRLGIFLHTAVREGYRTGGATTSFNMTYHPLTPSLTGRVPPGQAVGADLQDGARLTGSLQDARATTIDNAIRRLARLAAVVTAHECGHSMGLVVNGPMPTGLYGNDLVNFPLSPGQPAMNANGHIQNISLFPPGAQNVMSPAINFDTAQSTSTGFNSLNRAYLREQALYNEQ